MTAKEYLQEKYEWYKKHWNEHEHVDDEFTASEMEAYHQAKLKLLGIADVGGSIDSMKKAMDSFEKELKAANEENPDDLVIKGANWGYNKAVEQFHNRFAKYCG